MVSSLESFRKYQRTQAWTWEHQALTRARFVAGDAGIGRAFEDAWIPNRRSITFIGEVRATDGRRVNELFRLDYPETFELPDPGPATAMLLPPESFRPIRLTRFADRPGHTGLTTQPRHWPRASPDGSQVACLVEDGRLVLVGFDGAIRETAIRIDSAFTWHPDGERLAAVVEGHPSIVLVDTETVMPVVIDVARPEACVISPDGRSIAFVRETATGNQIDVANIHEP
jgi:hypothetical protein